MKKFKKLSGLLILTLGLSLLGGCGKNSHKKELDAMVNKYSKYCTLGEYKGIEFEAVNTEVTDEMIQAQVNNLLSSYSTTESKTSGTVNYNDSVNIDFVGTVDGKEFEGGNTNGAGYNLTIGSGTFIDDFEDQIVGHKVGDNFDVNVTFPEEYPSNPDLANADAIFNVTINSIDKIVYPEYNDEFVASYTDAASVEEYEQSIRENLEENYKSSDESANKSIVISKVIENATINEYPTQEMEELIDKTITNLQTQAQNMGYSLDEYVRSSYGFASEEDFKNYLSSIVEDYLKEKIIICSVAKAEKITVSDKEIKEFKKKIMDSYGITDEDKFKEAYDDEDVLYYTLADKVTSFLLDNAVATNTDASTESNAE